MNDTKPIIFEKEWVLESGDSCKMTIRADGPLTEEDKAFIRRFLPLAAGSIIDELGENQ